MKKLIHTCLCGKEFEANRLNHVYCSLNCNWRYQKRKRRGADLAKSVQPRTYGISRSDYNLRRRYGITSADYERMHEAQGGLCAICGQPEKYVNQRWGKLQRLAVDHDHKTGKVRQLLCKDCNVAIALMDESTDRILSAIGYLRSHTRITGK